MDPQRWAKVQDLFHQAAELPAPERDAWLDRVCEGDAELRAEVASLLASDNAAGGEFIGSHVERAVLEFHEYDSASGRRTMEGRQVGPYPLLRELGRGGMGAVYLAARSDEQYESEVAIKLVRPGPGYGIHSSPIPPGEADPGAPAPPQHRPPVRRRHHRR